MRDDLKPDGHSQSSVRIDSIEFYQTPGGRWRVRLTLLGLTLDINRRTLRDPALIGYELQQQDDDWRKCGPPGTVDVILMKPEAWRASVREAMARDFPRVNTREED